jgi:dUTP pyrophosphatase
MQVTQITNSSNVFFVGHDGKDLYAAMKGGTYRYVAVPEACYTGIANAESAGKYLNEHVKPFHDAQRCDEIDLASYLSEEPVSISLHVNTKPAVEALENAFGVKVVGTLTRGSEHAAGYDLQSTEKVIIQSGQRAVVPTGVFVQMPKFMAAQVLARSGLAAKKGITVVNGPGLIDPDYRGEIKVILHNLGDQAFEIELGDRIAQLMFSPFFTPTLIPVGQLDDDTERGTKGFGSTGVVTDRFAGATELQPRTKSA